MDKISRQKRSENMRRIRSKNTAPELAVRRILREANVHYRLHRNLPGRPDISIGRLHTAIFVHGCFWHQHEGCPRAFVPSTHNEFWNKKLNANAKRDIEIIMKLKILGWNSEVIWECKTRDNSVLRHLLDPIIQAYRESVSGKLERRTQALSGKRNRSPLV